MPSFRLPYPGDPDRRRAIFEAGAAQIARHGGCEGTPEEGRFWGSTPIGGFEGSYRLLDSGEMEFVIAKKPFLVTMGMIEAEARRFLGRA